MAGKIIESDRPSFKMETFELEGYLLRERATKWKAKYTQAGQNRLLRTSGAHLVHLLLYLIAQRSEKHEAKLRVKNTNFNFFDAKLRFALLASLRSAKFLVNFRLF